jgi:hypothetical protein
MPLDYKDAEDIARELIAKIASEWKDTANNRCLLEVPKEFYEPQTPKGMRKGRLHPPAS